MKQADPHKTRRRGLWKTLAVAAVSGAVAIAVPVIPANADPAPSPSPSPNAPAPTPPDPNAGPDAGPGPGGPDAAPPATDPLAGPPGAEPNVPDPGRVENAVGGFTYVIPAGWVESDASHLDYGSALLSKETGPPPSPGQQPPVATDTRIVLGKLDQKLYASAETDNAKAATRLASDMGEFFMPYPGTRINQDTVALNANGMTGSASYYEVRFTDTSKPNGQIWAGVIGTGAPGVPQNAQSQRWFVVWLGTANDPVDRPAAKTLAESIRPFTAPPAPAGPPAPGAPAAPPAPGASPAPGAPPAPEAPGTPPAPGAPGASPAPGAPAPAPGAPAGPASVGDTAPSPAAPPQPTVST